MGDKILSKTAYSQEGSRDMTQSSRKISQDVIGLQVEQEQAGNIKL